MRVPLAISQRARQSLPHLPRVRKESRCSLHEATQFTQSFRMTRKNPLVPTPKGAIGRRETVELGEAYQMYRLRGRTVPVVPLGQDAQTAVKRLIRRGTTILLLLGRSAPNTAVPRLRLERADAADRLMPDGWADAAPIGMPSSCDSNPAPCPNSWREPIA